MDVFSYLIIIIGLLFDGFFIYNDAKYHNFLSIILKTLASLSFVILGLYLYKGKGLLVLICLIFDMLGDFILILRNRYKQYANLIFVLGTMSFLIAHVIFMLYLLRLNLHSFKKGIFIAFFLYFILSYYFNRHLNIKGKLKILGSLYLFFITLNGTLAFYNYFLIRSYPYFIYMLGSLAFLFSDLILILFKFGKVKRDYLQIIYRLLYYLSQLLFAFYIGLL